MANLVRRTENEGVQPSFFEWDPFATMRQLLAWDPFRELREPRPWATPFMPSFDVSETPEAHVFRADLPGMEDKDVEVTVTGNRLTVSGVRQREERRQDESVYTVERSFGRFSRSFTLPAGADLEHVEGELANGVLTIHVPRSAAARPRRIELKGRLSQAVSKVKGLLQRDEDRRPTS